MMNKHGNTFFPEEKVAQVAADGTKVAGRKSGIVKNADPDSGRVKVAWDSGEETWAAPEDLAKI